MGTRPIVVLDAPSDLGLRPTGVRDAPPALRRAGIAAAPVASEYAGRVEAPAYSAMRDPGTGVHNLTPLAVYSRTLADHIGSILDGGSFPLVLGGDCSILLGSALALRRRGRYGLFFIDGHADFYAPQSEPNGEVASMDLAIVTGAGPPELTDLEGRRPLVREPDVVLFGYRDAADAGVHGSPDVRATAITALDLGEARRRGCAAAAADSADLLRKRGVDGIWIHLDADVLNDAVMPAVDYRMPDGLWPDELEETLTTVLRSRLVAGMHITIYNPSLDTPDRASGQRLAAVVRRALATR